MGIARGHRFGGSVGRERKGKGRSREEMGRSSEDDSLWSRSREETGRRWAGAGRRRGVAVTGTQPRAGPSLAWME